MSESHRWNPRKHGRRLLFAGVAGAVLVGGGAALAATGTFSPKQEQQAVISDAAGRLGVTPEKLNSALQQALIDRVNQAVKDGRLTQQQADAVIAQIKAGNFPLVAPGVGGGFGGKRHFRGPGGPGMGPFGDVMNAAATYLGVTPAQLQAARQGGKTLEQIAKDKGKSVDGLKTAMHNAAKAQLDTAVKNGKLTQQQADRILTGVDQWISHEITENEGQDHHGFGWGGGPPPGAPGTAPPGTDNPWGGAPPAPPVGQGA
jgi:polyhydroxyalkanoate synthesis regulator phasin